MRRREFISLLSGAVIALPHGVIAQDSTKRPLVAVLSSLARVSVQPRLHAFLQGLRDHGRYDDQNIDVEYRFADAHPARYPALAEELVRLKPDVIVATNTTATLACKQATAIIPIVSANLTDPIGMGLIASLARPGGNVTGMVVTLEGLPGKLLQLLLELKPGLTKVGLFVIVGERGSAVQRQDAESAGAPLGVKFVLVEVRTSDEFAGAFQALTQAHVEAVLVPSSALITNERSDFAAGALAARLPTMFNNRELVEAGGLMSYGVDLKENFRRAAYFVDRILKGAKPADLPVEIPTKFELVLNLATAKALGLTIPQSILFRADEVIE
jgi:putative tryptophan/tyrosine transport system substrate-binding protein